MKEEIWKDIPGWEGRYKVSNFGRILSTPEKRKPKIIKPSPNEHGYLMFHLYRDGVNKTVKVHRTVAAVFVENPDNMAEVNHIDGNKKNNRADNLEWTDRKGNMRHANATGLRDNMPEVLRKVREAQKIPVIGRNVQTGEEFLFDSVHEAARQIKTTATKVSCCINGKRKSTRGYTFRKAVIE